MNQAKGRDNRARRRVNAYQGMNRTDSRWLKRARWAAVLVGGTLTGLAQSPVLYSVERPFTITGWDGSTTVSFPQLNLAPADVTSIALTLVSATFESSVYLQNTSQGLNSLQWSQTGRLKVTPPGANPILNPPVPNPGPLTLTLSGSIGPLAPGGTYSSGPLQVSGSGGPVALSDLTPFLGSGTVPIEVDGLGGTFSFVSIVGKTAMGLNNNEAFSGVLRLDYTLVPEPAQVGVGLGLALFAFAAVRRRVSR